MICFVCKAQGRETPALAMCVVCGMALCGDHAVREELPLWERVSLGMTEARRQLPLKLPRFVCRECSHALSQKRQPEDSPR